MGAVLKTKDCPLIAALRALLQNVQLEWRKDLLLSTLPNKLQEEVEFWARGKFELKLLSKKEKKI